MTVDDLDAAYARTVESGVDLDEPRECHMYRIKTWNHEAFMRGRRVKELGYLGESGREPQDRLPEHWANQPWSDLYAGHEVDDEVFACKRDVVEAEHAAVVRERPRYNVEFNGRNSDRCPPWQAIEERHQRDRMFGRPLWQPPRPRAPRAQSAVRVAAAPRAARAPRAQPAVPARRVEPPLRRNRWPWRLGIWAALSLILWTAGLIWAPLPGHLLTVPATALAAAGMVVRCWKWNRRRGWRKTTCEGWATALALVAFVSLLYAAGVGAS